MENVNSAGAYRNEKSICSFFAIWLSRYLIFNRYVMVRETVCCYDGKNRCFTDRRKWV